MSKKTRKMLRALRKMKGGEVEEAVATADTATVPEEQGGRRRRRRGTRRSRRSRRHAGLFA
jgi:hypothetical protein